MAVVPLELPMTASKASKPTILLHGHFHTNNFGDVILAAIFRKWIHDAAPGATIVCPQTPWDVASHVGATRPWRITDAFTHDAMLLAGGGYFGDDGYRPWVWTARMGKHIGWISTASVVLGKPSGAFCVGSGPLHNAFARRWAAWYANHCEFFSVRDADSQNWMVRHGAQKERVILSADAAILASDLCSPSKSTNDGGKVDPSARMRVVGLHLNGLPKHYDDLHRIYQTVTRQAEKNHWRIVFLNDQVTAPSIRDLAKKWGCFDSVNPNVVDCHKAIDFLHRLRDLDLIITTKLHVGVCGVALGVPVISLPYHMKTPRFYERAGLSSCCVSIEKPGWITQLTPLLERAFTSGLDRPVVPAALKELAMRNRHDVESLMTRAGAMVLRAS